MKRLIPTLSLPFVADKPRCYAMTLKSGGFRRSLIHTVSIGMLCLSGCSTLPRSGPTAGQVVDQAKAEQNAFDYIEIDPQVIHALESRNSVGFNGIFGHDGRPAGPTIGVGDVLNIQIWQSGVSGVSGSQTSLSGAAIDGDTTRPPISVPDQVVGPDGYITVPYSGRLRAAGQSVSGLQAAIGEKLRQRLVEPQAIVTVTKSISETVTVSGEAIGTVRVPLSVRGDRVLDIIAAAGGSKTPIYETFVRLARRNVTATIPMSILTSDPTENIPVWPDDTITMLHSPETFTVMGATVNNSEISFGADSLNLVQAIAKAGGLQDTRADPTGVFLLRFEPPQVVAAAGAKPLPMGNSDLTPVVYHLDLDKIHGYFLAERFPVINHDILYIANARSDAAQKLFTLIGQLSAPVFSGAILSRGTR